MKIKWYEILKIVKFLLKYKEIGILLIRIIEASKDGKIDEEEKLLIKQKFIDVVNQLF
jgi:hypothetical protein